MGLCGVCSVGLGCFLLVGTEVMENSNRNSNRNSMNNGSKNSIDNRW